MPRRPKNSLGPLILYHGCDREIAEAVLSGKGTLQPSENDYDWLGPGIYFWVDSPNRALDWAKDRKKRRPQEMGVGWMLFIGQFWPLTSLTLGG